MVVGVGGGAGVGRAEGSRPWPDRAAWGGVYRGLNGL